MVCVGVHIENHHPVKSGIYIYIYTHTQGGLKEKYDRITNFIIFHDKYSMDTAVFP
jgi:hypothetical protein